MEPFGEFRYMTNEPFKLADSLRSPRSVEEIQGVLHVANEYKIPLWTFSRGKNLGLVVLLEY